MARFNFIHCLSASLCFIFDSSVWNARDPVSKSGLFEVHSFRLEKETLKPFSKSSIGRVLSMADRECGFPLINICLIFPTYPASWEEKIFAPLFFVPTLFRISPKFSFFASFTGFFFYH